MAYIGKTPVIGNFVKLDSITVVNGQAAYTMQNGGVNFTDYSTVNQFLVSLNGTIQSPGSSFTVSGSTLTFASNLSTGDVIDFIIVFGNSLSAGTPTDGTVTNAKLSSGSFSNITGTGTLTNFASTGIDDNATSTAITIDSDEKVGIGTTSPDSGLHITQDVNPVLKLDRGSANSTNLNLNYNGTLTGQISTGSNSFEVSAVGASTPTKFFVNGSERMRIDTSGQIILTHTPPIKSLDFGSCNVTIANGSYIDFASTSGIWILTETVGTGQTGVLASGGGSTTIIGQTGSIYSNSSSSGSVRFFNNSGTSSYRLQNNYGITLAFGICHISTRAST